MVPLIMGTPACFPIRSRLVRTTFVHATAQVGPSKTRYGLERYGSRTIAAVVVPAHSRIAAHIHESDPQESIASQSDRIGSMPKRQVGCHASAAPSMRPTPRR